MSSQRGNVRKTGAPKHQNKSAFRNNLHDTSKQTKIINSLDVSGCCAKCKGIIDWKIKYKKYKPLTVPKKCTKCNEKTIKRAYYIVCKPCAKKEGICAKCAQKNEIVQMPGLTPEEEAALQSQLEQELKLLPERQRRTFHRLQTSGKLQKEEESEGACAASVELQESEHDRDDSGPSDEDQEDGETQHPGIDLPSECEGGESNDHDQLEHDEQTQGGPTG